MIKFRPPDRSLVRISEPRIDNLRGIHHPDRCLERKVLDTRRGQRDPKLAGLLVEQAYTVAGAPRKLLAASNACASALNASTTSSAVAPPSGVAGEGEHLEPGGELDGEGDDGAPDRVLRE